MNFMTPVDSGSVPGAFLTHRGQYVVPTIDM